MVDRAIALRIDFLRLALVAGIVVLHTPPTWLLEALPPDAHHWPGVIKLFLDYGPFRAGVPVLSLISGYLLFLRPYASYRTMVQRKLLTLVVPFVVWNALVVGLRALRGQTDLSIVSGCCQDLSSWLMPLRAVLGSPPNVPTYFLIDLFILTLLSPLIGILMRRAPVISLAAGGLAAALDFGPVPTVRPDIALAFAAGAGVALQRIDPRVLDRYGWPLAICFLAMCMAFVASLSAGHDTSFMLGPLRAAGVPAVWAVSAVLAPTAVGLWIARRSDLAVILFCAHWPALHLLASVWPHGAGYRLFYVVAAPLVIAVVLSAAGALKRWAPWSRVPTPARAPVADRMSGDLGGLADQQQYPGARHRRSDDDRADGSLLSQS